MPLRPRRPIGVDASDSTAAQRLTFAVSPPTAVLLSSRPAEGCAEQSLPSADELAVQNSLLLFAYQIIRLNQRVQIRKFGLLLNNPYRLLRGYFFMSEPITAEDRAPDTPYRWRWVAMIILVLGFMLDLLNVTVVNVGLPAIQAGLGATSAQVGWIATAYLLAFAATMITSARLGDLFGRKRVFLTGLGGFAAAGAWSALAQSPGELIAARATQGAAAAIVAPQVLASLFVLFRGPERATVLGVFGVVAGFTQAGGLVLGGVLVTADVGGSGWRAVFWVTVPVAVVLLALGLR